MYRKAEALFQLGRYEHALVFYHRGHMLRPEVDHFRIGIQKAQEAVLGHLGMNNLKIVSKTGFETVIFKCLFILINELLGSQIFEANFENGAKERSGKRFSRSAPHRSIGTRLSRQNDRSLYGSSNEIAQKRKEKVLTVKSVVENSYPVNKSIFLYKNK